MKLPEVLGSWTQMNFVEVQLTESAMSEATSKGLVVRRDAFAITSI